jgi:hemoglobin-like flavoprotein
MVQRARSFWKRPRDSRSEAAPDATAAEGMPRGRRRRTHFAERLDRAREAIGYTDADAARVQRTGPIVREAADAITERMFARMLDHPDMSHHFTGVSGESIDTRRESFGRWLLAAADGKLDAKMASYLAEIGHAHVRPRTPGAHPVRARFIVAIIGQVQAAITEILATAINDSSELAACVTAWDRLLAVHLDVMLAVYSGAEGHARWY